MSERWSLARTVLFSVLVTTILWAIITGVALWFFSTPAKAETLDCQRMYMPPPELDKALPYDPIIKIMPAHEVIPYCLANGVIFDHTLHRLPSCEFRHFMVLPQVGTEGITLDFQRCSFFHERAHMLPNDWPGNHPHAEYW